MTDSKKPTLRVAISGGGIGGCALALALQRHDINVILFEKDSSFAQRRQGYGLTLQQGHRGCRTLGLADKLVARDTPSSSHLIFAADGHLVSFFGPAFFARASQEEKQSTTETVQTDAIAQSKTTVQTEAQTPELTESFVQLHMSPPKKVVPSKAAAKSRWNPPDSRKAKLHNVHTPRQVLRQLLLEQVRPETIHWGSKVTSYTEHADKVTVILDDGRQEDVDLLVGADGLFSSVRQQLVGDGLNYLGVLVVLGISKTSHPLLKGRVLQTVNGCTRIFIMPFTEEGEFSSYDSVMWQLSFPCDEKEAKRLSADPGLLRAEALARCGDWHVPLPELLAATPLDFICGTPVWDREPPQPKHCLKRVVLLGDAAHPMSPFKGQGANQALLDACLLAELLSELPLDQAIPAYQSQMCARSTQQVLGSRACVARLHSEASLSSEDWATHRGLSPAHVKAVERIGAWCGGDIEKAILTALAAQPTTISSSEGPET